MIGRDDLDTVLLSIHKYSAIYPQQSVSETGEVGAFYTKSSFRLLSEDCKKSR